MKTPTLEEVKEYFKDALAVKCIAEDLVFNYSSNKIRFDGEEYYIGNKETENHRDYVVIQSGSNWAEIIKYKSNKVKNPNAKHYELWQDFEAIDIIKATLTKDEYLGYLKGNIIKYKLRDKGQDESDKVKIKDYTNELNNLINK